MVIGAVLLQVQTAASLLFSLGFLFFVRFSPVCSSPRAHNFAESHPRVFIEGPTSLYKYIESDLPTMDSKCTDARFHLRTTYGRYLSRNLNGSQISRGVTARARPMPARFFVAHRKAAHTTVTTLGALGVWSSLVLCCSSCGKDGCYLTILSKDCSIALLYSWFGQYKRKVIHNFLCFRGFSTV